MPEPEEHLSGLPEVLRNSNRPIVIYQGAPAHQLDVQTHNALGLLSWLVLLTVCLGAILFCVWQVWNPGRDQSQFSPIYADGRPRGLAGQIEERRQINESAEGLIEFLDRVRADNLAGRRSTATHPLISDRGGIDDLRSQWDAMCSNIRARIYDRRLGQLDARIADLRRQRSREANPAERVRINGELQTLQQLRSDQVERRRTDSDPALQCIPAAQAPVCSHSSNDEWCNPELKRPRDFVDEAT
jgi:hypothetical protein